MYGKNGEGKIKMTFKLIISIVSLSLSIYAVYLARSCEKEQQRYLKLLEKAKRNL
jgi:uncharacterized protein (UPF0333 family)